MSLSKWQNNPRFCFSDQTRFQFQSLLPSLCRTPGVYFLAFLPLINSSCFWFKKQNRTGLRILKGDAKPWGYGNMSSLPGLGNNLLMDLKEKCFGWNPTNMSGSIINIQETTNFCSRLLFLILSVSDGSSEKINYHRLALSFQVSYQINIVIYKFLVQ